MANKVTVPRDWGQYVDLNRRLVTSLEKLREYIKSIDNKSDIDAKDVHSFGYWATMFDPTFKFSTNSDSKWSKVKEILNSIRYHSRKIQEMLDGEEGLITLTKKEINDIESFLKTNPQLPTEAQNRLNDLVNNYNSKKMRLWEDMRNMMGREQSLGISLINFEEMSVKEVVDIIISKIKELKHIIDEKGSDEAIFMKLVELNHYMKGFKDGLQTEYTNEVKTIGDADFKKLVARLSLNYFQFYKAPIEERIEFSVVKLNDAQGKFMNLSDEGDKEKVLKLYSEMTDSLFKGTEIEDKFKDRKTKDKLKKLKDEFAILVGKLREKVADKYSIPSENDFMDLLLYKEEEGFLNKLFKFGTTHKEEKLSIKDVKAKIDSNLNEDKLVKFLETTNKNLNNYISDTGFKSFESMQDSGSFIGSKDINELKKEYNKLYWDLSKKIADDKKYSIAFGSGSISNCLIYARDLQPTKFSEFEANYINKADAVNRKKIVSDVVEFLKILLTSDKGFDDYMKYQVSKGNITGIKMKASGGGSSSNDFEFSDDEFSDEQKNVIKREFGQYAQVMVNFLRLASHEDGIDENNFKDEATKLKVAIDYFSFNNVEADEKENYLLKICREVFGKVSIDQSSVKDFLNSIGRMKVLVDSDLHETTQFDSTRLEEEKTKVLQLVQFIYNLGVSL